MWEVHPKPLPIVYFATAVKVLYVKGSGPVVAAVMSLAHIIRMLCNVLHGIAGHMESWTKLSQFHIHIIFSSRAEYASISINCDDYWYKAKVGDSHFLYRLTWAAGVKLC